MRALCGTVLLPSILLAAACSSSDLTTGPNPSDLTVAASTYPGVATVTVSPPTIAISVGQQMTLVAYLKDTNGNRLPKTVHPTWSSSDTTVATVTQSGVVLGKKNGVAVIRATYGSAAGSSAATVGTGISSTSTSTTSLTSSTSTPSTSTNTTTTSTTTTSTTQTGSSLSGKQFVGDDFSSYTSTAALQANISSAIGGTGSPSTALYKDGANPSLIQLDPTVQYNGHATMKYVMPGGVNTTPRLSVYFPGGKTLTKMWYRTKIRFSSGFTTSGTLTNSANAYKMLGWGWLGPYGSGRLEITNTNQYDFYWDVMDKTTGQVIISGSHASPGMITTEWSDAGWYDYIVEVDFTPGTSGVARIYMARDGQQPTLRATSTGTILNSTATLPPLNLVALGLNFNQVRAAGQNQALWYGQWEVVDGSVYSDPYGVK